MNRNDFIVNRTDNVQIFSNGIELNRKRIIKRRTKTYKPFRMTFSAMIVAKRKQKFDNKLKIKEYRRERRRRCNLLTRTASSNDFSIQYLRNHLWHTKRMLIKNMYGFNIPIKSQNKGFKACQRFYKTNCIIEDNSYTRLISISSDNLYKLQTIFHSYTVR